MRIGVPTEVLNGEYRIAMTPAGVHQLVQSGHYVKMEFNGGIGAGICDDEYELAGAVMCTDPQDVWDADLIVKVKEPQPSEFKYLTKNQTLFTFLHLAAHEDLTRQLLASGTTAISYEDVRAADGTLPLLAPMSEVAGRIAPQVGAYHLMMAHGGAGVLLAGVPGAPRGKTVIVGGGVAGRHAAEIAVGMRAEVTVLDVDVPKLREIDRTFAGRVNTLFATDYTIAREVQDADLVIGAVLRPGARAPHVVTSEMTRRMKAGAVLVDIAIDQGGCFEDSHATSHDNPTYLVGESVFYCVSNMPGSVPVTATAALTAATLPYVARIAQDGWLEAARQDPGLAAGLTTHRQRLYAKGVGQAHGMEVTPIAEALATA